MPNIINQSEGRGQYIVSSSSSSSSSDPIPNYAIPIPYDIHQKASNTLDTENTLNDDVIKKKLDTNTETDIVINL